MRWYKQPINPKVTATSNGFSNSIVPMVQSLPPAAIKGPSKVCNVESSTLFEPVSYSQNLTYHWTIDGAESNAVQPLVTWASTGNKDVILKTTDINTQCTNSDTLKVTVSKYILTGVENQDGVYTPLDRNPLYTYKWQQFKDNTWVTVGEGQSFVPATIGNYQLSITDQYGCSNSGTFYVKEIVTGLKDWPEEVKLVPNPATTSFQVLNLPKANSPTHISVIDMAGRSQFSGSTIDGSLEINCSRLNQGVYLVLAQSEGKVKYLKLLIN